MTSVFSLSPDLLLWGKTFKQRSRVHYSRFRVKAVDAVLRPTEPQLRLLQQNNVCRSWWISDRLQGNTLSFSGSCITITWKIKSPFSFISPSSTSLCSPMSLAVRLAGCALSQTPRPSYLGCFLCPLPKGPPSVPTLSPLWRPRAVQLLQCRGRAWGGVQSKHNSIQIPLEAL